MTESRPNRHSRANDTPTALVTRDSIPFNLRSNDGRRAYVVALLESDGPAERARGRAYLETKLSGSDVDTVLALGADALSAHPEESAEILATLRAYLRRTKKPGACTDGRLIRALIAPSVSTDCLREILRHCGLAQLPVELSRVLAGYLAERLAVAEVGAEAQSELFATILTLLNRYLPQEWADDGHPGGPILHRVIASGRVARDLRVKALAIWMARRRLPAPRAQELDRTIDPDLRARVLLCELDTVRAACSSFDAPLVDRLVAYASGKTEPKLAPRALGQLVIALQSPDAPFDREALLRRLLDLALAADVSPSARECLLDYLTRIALHLPKQLRWPGVRHPGENASVDQIAVALALGAAPLPGDFPGIARALQELVDRASAPSERKTTLPQILDADVARYRLVHHALRGALQYRWESLRLPGLPHLPYATWSYANLNLDAVNRIVAELPYLESLFQTDGESWERVLTDVQAPAEIRQLFFRVVERHNPSSLDTLLRDRLLADPLFSTNAAERIYEKHGATVLFEALASRPSPHQSKLGPFLSRVIRKDPSQIDAVLQLRAHPAVAASPSLRGALNGVVLSASFPDAFQWDGYGNDEAALATLSDAVVAALSKKSAPTRNPLRMMRLALMNASPEESGRLRQLFVSPAFRFYVGQYLSTRSVTNLPTEFLCALFRANAHRRTTTPQAIELIKEFLSSADPLPGLEALRVIDPIPRIGALADRETRSTLLRMASLDRTGDPRSPCARLWQAHASDDAWLEFLRDAYRDPAVPDALLRTVTSLQTIARVWERASETDRGAEAFRQRLFSSCFLDGNLKFLVELTESDLEKLYEITSKSPDPRAREVRRSFASYGRTFFHPTSAGPRVTRNQGKARREADEGLRQAAEKAKLDGRWTEVIGALTAGTGQVIDTQPVIQLVATNPVSREVRQALRRHLMTWPRSALRIMLDPEESAEARESASAQISRFDPNQARNTFDDVAFVVQMILDSEDAASTAGLRPWLATNGVLDPKEENGADRLVALTAEDLAGARRWLALYRAGRLEAFWRDGTLGECDEADARLLLRNLLSWGLLLCPDVRAVACARVLSLPLPQEERVAALEDLVQTSGVTDVTAFDDALLRIAWGEEPSDMREVVQKIVERAIKSPRYTRYPSKALCLAIIAHPNTPAALRASTVLRLGRWGHRFVVPGFARLVLDPGGNDAQRERLLTAATQARFQIPVDAASRAELLALIGDRRRAIGVRKKLIETVQLLVRTDSPDPAPAHWEAAEAAAGAPPAPDQDDALGALWALVADNRLSGELRTLALRELLVLHEVPARSRLSALVTLGASPQESRWFLEQLRSAKRLPDQGWRQRILAHNYQTDPSALWEVAARHPHLPAGFALLAADLIAQHPGLGATLEQAFTARRGAVATSSALVTWMEFLNGVAEDRVPASILALFSAGPDAPPDDPTPLAQTWLRWQSLGIASRDAQTTRLWEDRSRPFADRAAALDQHLFEHAARLFVPQRASTRDVPIARLAQSLRQVTPRTPAPIVLAGHYRRCHPEGLPLLGAATTAWAEGTWGGFKYDPSQNRTLASLPGETVAAWRAPLGFAVAQISATSEFQRTTRDIRAISWQIATRLPTSLASERARLGELQSDHPDPDAIARAIGELEAKAVSAGQASAGDVPREEAGRLRERARSLRLLASLARFAFLDPDALAVNELRASGEHNQPLPDGRVQRAISIRRAFDRLKGQLRDLPRSDALQASVTELEHILSRLPEFPERTDLVVEERDDFPTLIEIGARPYGSGSCQNYQSALGYNKALLAYVCDGDKKALVVREAGALPPGAPPDLRARAILRLGRTAQGDLALLLEPIYATGGRGDQLRQEIEDLARRKAAILRAVLLRVGGGSGAETIELAPSRNGFQYEDSGGGLRSDADGYALTLPILADYRGR